MSAPAQFETVWYRGYEIEVCSKDFLVFAPNRDVACFPSMSRVRLWVRQHRGDRTRNRGREEVIVESDRSETPERGPVVLAHTTDRNDV